MNTTTNTRGVSGAMVERIEGIMREDCPGSTETQIKETALRIAALSAPEPAAQGEAVNVPGYDVGWKIRGVTAYDVAARKGYRHPECVEAAIKAAPPAQPAERVRVSDAARFRFVVEHNWIGAKTRCTEGIQDSDIESARRAVDRAMLTAAQQAAR